MALIFKVAFCSLYKVTLSSPLNVLYKSIENIDRPSIKPLTKESGYNGSVPLDTKTRRHALSVIIAKVSKVVRRACARVFSVHIKSPWVAFCEHSKTAAPCSYYDQFENKFQTEWKNDETQITTELKDSHL